MPLPYPWEFHQDLSAARLKVIARLLWEARKDALAHHLPELGDTPWVHGCRSFEWSRHRIRMAAMREADEWLSLAKDEMEFVFQIGRVKARFYKGEPDDPHSRTLRRTFAELDQGSLDFGEPVLYADVLWRFAVETDDDGDVIAITVVGLTEGSGVPVSRYDVPLLDLTSGPVELFTDSQEGVDLPPPPVGPRGPEDDAEAGNDQ